MLAELGLTLATSKVKRDEPSPDRPHDQCVNLFLFFGIRVIMVLESGSFANLVSRPPLGGKNSCSYSKYGET